MNLPPPPPMSPRPNSENYPEHNQHNTSEPGFTSSPPPPLNNEPEAVISPVEDQPEKKNRVPLYVGLGLLGVAAAAGAFAFAYDSVSPDGNRPYNNVPGNAIVYAEVNFDPSISQKASYLKLQKLLTDNGANSKGNLKDTLFSSLSEDSVTYDEIKPFVKDRGAFVAYPDSNADKRPEAFVMYQVTDAAKAQDYVKNNQELRATVVNDYIIFPQSSDTDEKIVRNADAENLGDNKQFVSDAKAVGMDNVGLVWINMDKDTLDLAQQEAAMYGSVPSAELNELRLAGSLSLLDNGVQADVETFAYDVGGSKVSLEGNSIKENIENLPASSIAGISINNLGDSIISFIESNDEYKVQAEQMLSQVGLSYPDSIREIMGENTTAAYSSNEKFIMKAKGGQLNETLINSLNSQDPNMSIVQQGETLILSNNWRIEDENILDARHKDSIPNLDKAQMGGFVSLDGLAQMGGSMFGDLSGTIGFSAQGTKGNNMKGSIRYTFSE